MCFPAMISCAKVSQFQQDRRAYSVEGGAVGRFWVRFCTSTGSCYLMVCRRFTTALKQP